MAAPRHRKKASSQVPGQFYGYSIQETRALAHLLRAVPGQAVSIEHLDDVATTSAADALLEQTKSGLAHNPVADRSVDLWKTLHNWIDAIRDGALGEDTKFVLYVAQQHSGTIVRALHDAKTRPEALVLVGRIKDDMWGEAPKRVGKPHLPGALACHVNAVLEASDDVLVQLILGFSLERGSGAPNDDLLPLIRNKALSESALEDALRYLLGWVKRETEKAIAAGRPAILSWEEFQKSLVAAARKFDRSAHVLSPTPVELTSREVEQELRERLYVRQLEMVSCEEAELVDAVNDYLRASADRTTWSERGDVLEDSFDDFEDVLCRGWDSQRKRVHIELLGRTELEIGKLLLANCMGLMVALQGMAVPSYFVPGSFHALADQLTVGWHPRFEELGGGKAESMSPAPNGPTADGSADTPATEEQVGGGE